MSRVYYNEHDKKAAEWLRGLIKDGYIAQGEVDERSIEDVKPSDLAGFTQCHFFAGIGGWSYALRLAGWPDDRPVWTGSCPCQPFSVAGKGKGTSDTRHLWPAFRWLIAQCLPATVFGEQVASKAGRSWLSGVRADLEAMGYGVGAADLCAASVNAPHIRQRLWWVGNAEDTDKGSGVPESEAGVGSNVKRGWGSSESGINGGVADCKREGSQRWVHGREAAEREDFHGHAGCDRSTHWSNTVWHPCKDGKARRIPAEPALCPLADGIPGRVGLLRGAGNAIVPQVAAEFISTYIEVLNEAALL